MNGNNALHLAHKNAHREVAKILEQNGFNDTVIRNHRGLAPI